MRVRAQSRLRVWCECAVRIVRGQVYTSTDGPGVVDESRDERDRAVADRHGRVEHNSHDVTRAVKVRVELHSLALVGRLALEVGPERQRTRNA